MAGNKRQAKREVAQGTRHRFPEPLDNTPFKVKVTTMIAQADIHSNGNSNVPVSDFAPCASDYEPPPAYDAPMPGWRDQHPKYVHHVEWLDSDNRKHGLTVRTDDYDEFVATLRVVKAASQPQSPAEAEQQADDVPEPDAEEKPASKPCPVHPYDLMYRRPSKHGGHFYSHRLDDGSWCNGKAK